MNRFRLDPRLQTQLVNTYLDTIPLITLNVVWFLTCLPIVTIFPATAGLLYATNLLAHDKPVRWQDLFEGMRRYFWHSWLWGALNLIAFAIIFSNSVYYAQNPSTIAGIARLAITMLGVFWVSLQLYMFPLLMEQDKPRLDTAFRNSLVILLKRPWYSLRIALLLIVVGLFSTAFIWPIWIVITAAYCARTANVATISSIAKISGHSPPTSPVSEEIQEKQ